MDSCSVGPNSRLCTGPNSGSLDNDLARLWARGGHRRRDLGSLSIPQPESPTALAFVLCCGRQGCSVWPLMTSAHHDDICLPCTLGTPTVLHTPSGLVPAAPLYRQNLQLSSDPDLLPRDPDHRQPLRVTGPGTLGQCWVWYPRTSTDPSAVRRLGHPAPIRDSPRGALVPSRLGSVPSPRT